MVKTMEMTKVLMNPVRQRIFQYLLVHEKGTVKEMKKELSDIPNASLYRHIKILTDNSVITVVEENRIRGTIESVYQLNKNDSRKDMYNNLRKMIFDSVSCELVQRFRNNWTIYASIFPIAQSKNILCI